MAHPVHIRVRIARPGSIPSGSQWIFRAFQLVPPDEKGTRYETREGEGRREEAERGSAPGLHRDRDAMYTRCIERDRTTKRARCDATQIRTASTVHLPSRRNLFSFSPPPLSSLPAFSDVLRRIVLINIGCPSAKIVSSGINAFL